MGVFRAFRQPRRWPAGPSDLADVDARRLQVALAAVVALYSRGTVLAEVAQATTGRVALADGDFGDFEITQHRYPEQHD